MPNPHFNITITKRSAGRSAVAGAAYQSGTKLFSEYDQKNKDYSNRNDVVYTRILLPANAPPEYADREILWNAAEEVEKQWNSQLARRLVLTLPREIPLEMCPQLVREYCEEHFVSKGMCCDLAIHDPDPPGHNPHCHVMLTMRALDENGKWLPKSRKVYDLNENGERIRLPSGNWKCHKESTVDWNEQYHGEEWRHGWEVIQNRYLEKAGSMERVDLRSYERQGLDIIPTVHMGPAVTQMERRGIRTNVGNLNRDIRAANRMLHTIRETIENLRGWITELQEAFKEIFTQQEPQTTSSDLINLLWDYLELRKAERSDWSLYGKQKGTAEDLKAISGAILYLKDHNLSTPEDLDAALHGMNLSVGEIKADLKKLTERMQVLSGIQNAISDCRTYQDVHDKYIRIGWKTRQAAFAAAHKEELDCYNKAFRYLKKHGADVTTDLKALQIEYADLQALHVEKSHKLAAVKKELQPMKEIRYWIGKILNQETAEPQKTAEPKHSVIEKMRFLQEQKNQTPEHKTPQVKKHKQER